MQRQVGSDRVTPVAGDGDRRAAERLAWLMDDLIRLPGGYRVGLDGILGLVPGIGDSLGLLASSYVLLVAYRYGVPATTLLRMTGNVLLETVVGAVPVLGDLFDFVWKANRRNVVLLEAHLTAPGPVTRRSSRGLVWVLVGALIVLLLVAVLALWLFIELVAWLWSVAA